MNTSPIITSAPPSATQTPSQPVTSPTSKNSKHKKFNLLLLIVALLCMLGAGFIAYGNFKTMNQTASIIIPSPISTPSSTFTNDMDTNSDWQVYSNTSYGYKLKFPAEWSIKESGKSGNQLASTLLGSQDGKNLVDVLVIEGNWDTDTQIDGGNGTNNMVVSGRPARILRREDAVVVSFPLEQNKYISILFGGMEAVKQSVQILSTFEFVGGSKKLVVITSPKNADSPGEFNRYQLEFEYPSANSNYMLSKSVYQELKVYDESYELFISFPTDGGSQTFDEVPSLKVLTNRQFGTINRISVKSEWSDYSYSNEFDADCKNWNPKPAGGCGLMQVGFINPFSEFGRTYIAISCNALTSSGIDACDKIVSNLNVVQLQ